MSISVPMPGSPPAPVATSGPLSIAELLDRTFRAMRARFGVLFLSAAIVMVPIGLLTALLTGRFMTGYFDLLQFSVTSPESAELAFEELFGQFVGYFGVILLLSLVSVLGTTTVNLMSMHHIERFLHGIPSTVAEGLRVALRRLLPLLGMHIVELLVIGLVTAVVLFAVGIVMFLAALVFGGAIAGLGNSSDAAGAILIVGMVILFLVGYLLLVVLMLAPTVFFMARWLAAAPSLLIEGLGPVKALQRSWALTTGRTWRGIIYVVLLALFSAVVISLPLVVTQQVAMLLAPEQTIIIMVLSTVAGYLLNLLYQPFYATGVVMYYYDLRVRAEAYDVALRVAALEAELAPDAPQT